MTDERRRMANDGYSNSHRTPTLSEGYVRKGGVNPPNSQIQTRPPAPPAMRPAVQNAPSRDPRRS